MNNKLFCLLCPIFGLKIKLEYEINLSLKRTASPQPTRISRSSVDDSVRVEVGVARSNPQKASQKKKVSACALIDSVFILLLLLFSTQRMKNYYPYSKKFMTMLEVFNTLIRIIKYISTIYFRFEYRHYIMKHTHCISKKSKQTACIIN